MTDFVVDASVVIMWLVDEPLSQAARQLQGRALAAPDFLLVEVANALWKLHRKGVLTRERSLARIEALRLAPLSVTPSIALVGQASGLAADLDHPVYDCLYLALALRESCPVVTADKKFFAKVEAHPYLKQFARVLQTRADE